MMTIEYEVNSGPGATNGSPGECGVTARIDEPICWLGIKKDVSSMTSGVFSVVLPMDQLSQRRSPTIFRCSQTAAVSSWKPAVFIGLAAWRPGRRQPIRTSIGRRSGSASDSYTTTNLSSVALATWVSWPRRQNCYRCRNPNSICLTPMIFSP
jgi:hypothetical protein